MNNPFDFFSNLSALEERFNKFQENCKNLSETGEAGGGLVKVTVNGDLQLTSIDIDPSLMKEESIETLKTLILSAANSAMTKIRETMRETAMQR